MEMYTRNLSRAVFLIVLVPLSLTSQVMPQEMVYAPSLSRCQSQTAMPEPPKLPVVVRHVLPGEGWGQLLGKWRVHDNVPLYDTWRANRKPTAVVQSGTTVTVVDGMNIVYKPDTVLVTNSTVWFGLAPGEKLFRYTYYGEGVTDFWANGLWYSKCEGSSITESNGTGCQTRCDARVVAYGAKDWWFLLRMPDSRTGWSNAVDSLNPNY